MRRGGNTRIGLLILMLAVVMVEELDRTLRQLSRRSGECRAYIHRGQKNGELEHSKVGYE